MSNEDSLKYDDADKENVEECIISPQIDYTLSSTSSINTHIQQQQQQQHKCPPFNINNNNVNKNHSKLHTILSEDSQSISMLNEDSVQYYDTDNDKVEECMISPQQQQQQQHKCSTFNINNNNVINNNFPPNTIFEDVESIAIPMLNEDSVQYYDADNDNVEECVDSLQMDTLSSTSSINTHTQQQQQQPHKCPAFNISNNNNKLETQLPRSNQPPKSKSQSTRSQDKNNDKSGNNKSNDSKKNDNNSGNNDGDQNNNNNNSGNNGGDQNNNNNNSGNNGDDDKNNNKKNSSKDNDEQEEEQQEEQEEKDKEQDNTIDLTMDDDSNDNQQNPPVNTNNDDNNVQQQHPQPQSQQTSSSTICPPNTNTELPPSSKRIRVDPNASKDDSDVMIDDSVQCLEFEQAALITKGQFCDIYDPDDKKYHIGEAVQVDHQCFTILFQLDSRKGRPFKVRYYMHDELKHVFEAGCRTNKKSFDKSLNTTAGGDNDDEDGDHKMDWSCSVCTFVNKTQDINCSMCGTSNDDQKFSAVDSFSSFIIYIYIYIYIYSLYTHKTTFF